MKSNGIFHILLLSWVVHACYETSSSDWKRFWNEALNIASSPVNDILWFVSTTNNAGYSSGTRIAYYNKT